MNWFFFAMRSCFFVGSVGGGDTSDNLGDHTATQDLVLGTNGISDSGSSVGTSGQVLSSTGTGTEWVDKSNDVLDFLQSPDFIRGGLEASFNPSINLAVVSYPPLEGVAPFSGGTNSSSVGLYHRFISGREVWYFHSKWDYFLFFAFSLQSRI